MIHGENDPTVPAAAADVIAAAATSPVRTMIIEGADHVFGTPNPMPSDQAPSLQLKTLIDALIQFARDCCRSARVSGA